MHLLGREMKGREVENLFAALHGGHIFITPPNLEEHRCTFLHPLHTNVVLVWCVAYVYMRSSPVGSGNIESNQIFILREGVLGEYVVRLRV